MLSILFAFLRAIFAFLLLMIVTRVMGRKTIAEMTFFDFGIAMTLGSVAANISIGRENTLTTGTTVLVTLCLVGFFSGYLHIKSFRLRKLMNSEPVIVIENGELIKENMKKIRLTVNELVSLLREKNYFNIWDVNFAIIENDGKISVLPKSDKRPLTPADMQIKPIEEGLTKDIIIDGNIMFENLAAANLTEQWLKNQLKNQSIYSVKEVFFAALDSGGNLYVSKGNKPKETHGEHGIE